MESRSFLPLPFIRRTTQLFSWRKSSLSLTFLPLLIRRLNLVTCFTFCTVTTSVCTNVLSFRANALLSQHKQLLVVVVLSGIRVSLFCFRRSWRKPSLLCLLCNQVHCSVVRETFISLTPLALSSLLFLSLSDSQLYLHVSTLCVPDKTKYAAVEKNKISRMLVDFVEVKCGFGS